MSIEQQAEQLAQWLAANPGTPPPEDVDPEVIEAVYSLRPELAPPANVDLDDILNSVERGPFQQHTEEISAQLSPPVALAEVIELSQMRVKAKAAQSESLHNASGRGPRQRTVPTPPQPQRLNVSPRFLVGSIGGVALLAAACALFILVPALQGEMRAQPTSSLAKNTIVTEPDAVPDDTVVKEDEIEADLAATKEEATPGRIDTPVPPPSAESEITRSVVSQPERTPMKEVTPAATVSIADENQGASRFADLEAVEDSRLSMGSVATTDSAPVLETSARASQEVVRAKKQRQKSVAKRADMGDDMAEAAPSADEAMGQWRSPVVPYPRDWSPPALNDREQQIQSEASALDERSNWSAAALVFQKAIAKSKSQVGQYFAAEATVRFLKASQTDRAIKAANRCVALSAQNTAHLSRCYCVLGDAYQAIGEEKKARTAYEKADRLNRKR